MTAPGTDTADPSCDVAVVTCVPAGFTAAELREVLRRRRELTRRSYLDVVGCPPAAAAAVRAALPHAVVVPVAGGVAGWNAALRAAPGRGLVVAAPFAVRFGRFWLEGLLAALAPDVAAVLPRAARWLPGALPGERFAAFAERIRQDCASAVSPVRATTGAVLLVRASLLAAAPLDVTFAGVAAAWRDRAAEWRAAGWRVVRADGVLVDDDHDDTETFAGLWLGPRPGADVERLVRRHGVGVLPDGLCAALIAKDEQGSLPRALASLVGVVDDVVVADTGSADDTVAVAEALGARVVHVPWSDDFAAARNGGLAHVTAEWALVVDADEEVEADDAQRIRTILRRSPGDAFLIQTHHLTGTLRRREGELVVPAARLFRTAVHEFERRIHEQVVRRDRAPIEWTVLEAVRFTHRGYLTEVVTGKGKGRRNADIARARYDRERTWLAAFECGRSLMLAADPVDAERYLRIAADGVPDEHPQASMLFRVLAQAAAVNERPDVLALARRAVELGRADIDSVLRGAELMMLAGEPLEAIATIDAYASAGPNVWWTNSSAAEVTLPALRGQALAAAGRAQEACDALREVAAEHPGEFGLWRLLVALLTDHDRQWPQTVARLAKRAPQRLIREMHEAGFDPEWRRALSTALRAEGVEVLATMADEFDSLGALGSAGAGDAADRARRVELTRPDSALSIWRTLPPSVERAAGEARCLVALGRTAEAHRCVRNLDPAALGAEDRLLAAVLAVEAGDHRRATALLDVQPLPPSLQAEAAVLRGAISAVPAAAR